MPSLPIWLFCFLRLTACLVHKSALLDTTTLSANGATLTYNPASTHIVDTTFSVVVGEQEEEYDLLLRLDASAGWAFTPDRASTISITLSGSTPFPAQDTDFLITLAVGDAQYLSFFAHLDSSSIKSRIFAHFSTSSDSEPVSTWMASNAIHDRWDRISNDGQWLVVPDWNKQALWPLRFEVVNDPTTNTSLFRFLHDLDHRQGDRLAVSWPMPHAFLPSQGIDLYIMGDSTGEQYAITHIDAQLSHNGTVSPTTAPSTRPTLSPTKAPTIHKSTRSPSTASPTTTTLPPTLQYVFSSTTSDSDEYGVTVSITLQYIFRDLTLSEIEDILLGIIDHLIVGNECKEAINPMATEGLNDQGEAVTIINATIIVCDEEAQQELLVAVTDPELQRDFVTEIDTQTDIAIELNRTHIEATAPTPRPTRAPISEFDDSVILTVSSSKGESGLSSSQWVLVMVLVQLAGCGCCVSIVILVYLKLKETKRRRKRTVEQIEKGYSHKQRGKHKHKKRSKEKEREKESEEKYNSSVTGSPESGQSTTNAMDERRQHKIESFSDGGDGYLMQHVREEENECEAMMNVLVHAEFARPKTPARPKSPRPPYKMREEIPGSPGEYGGDGAYDRSEERQRLQVRKEVRKEVRKTRGVSEDMYGQPKREDEPTPMLRGQNEQNGRPRTPDHAMYGGSGTRKGKGKATMSSASREIIFFDECGDEMSSESPDTSGSEIWNAAQCEKEEEDAKELAPGTGTEEEEMMEARSSTPMLTLPTHKVTKSQWM